MPDISSPSSSCPSIPSSRASSPRTLRRRQKRKDAIATYTLRPRDPNGSLVDESAVRHRRPGRLQDWQISILQEVFEADIQSPGDATIMLLVVQLKDRYESLIATGMFGRRQLLTRTEKQIRDWFSHRRRRLRETGVQVGPPPDERIPVVVESLILSRFERDYGKLEQLAGSVL